MGGGLFLSFHVLPIHLTFDQVPIPINTHLFVFPLTLFSQTHTHTHKSRPINHWTNPNPNFAKSIAMVLSAWNLRPSDKIDVNVDYKSVYGKKCIFSLLFNCDY